MEVVQTNEIRYSDKQLTGRIPVAPRDDRYQCGQISSLHILYVITIAEL